MQKREQLKAYLQLMRLHKPIGILLCLWPSLWALWFAAQGLPPIHILLIFIVGAIIVRSAGCVINDFADRNFDGKVARTAYRPLAQGIISAKQALLLFFVLLLIALILVLQLNRLTILLALVCVGLTVLYPFTKRFTHFAQFFLSLPFNWGVILAFSAVQNTVPLLAWVLFISCCFWTLAYDTMYAMVDREDDIKIGLKSTAVLFGHYDRLMIFICQCLFVFGLFLAGLLIHYSIWYDLACLSVVLFCLYQQKLIYAQKPKACFAAFMNNNWLGAVFFGFLLIALST